MSDEKNCPVCFDPFKFPKTLPCNHTFCLCCLKHFLRELPDKSNFVCPLCREPCFVPDNGFTDFPTNYFVPVDKIVARCTTCNKESGVQMIICSQCDEVLCRTCHVLHSHLNDREKEECDEDTPGLLPLHVRWPLMQYNVKAELVCSQSTVFSGAFPPNHDGKKHIRFMFPSKSNGVYVKLEGIDKLFKHNPDGKIVQIITFSGTVNAVKTSGIEMEDGTLLLSFLQTKTILGYIPTENTVRFQTITFANTSQFIFPTAMTELLNGDIAVCGPSTQCNDPKCKIKDCDGRKGNHGLVLIYSRKGELVNVIGQNDSGNLLTFPTKVAANSKTDTIAILEDNPGRVTLVDYSGVVRGRYEGLQTMILSFLPNLDGNKTFFAAVCSIQDGNFVISDPNKDYLQVLSPNGKFIAVLRCENRESFRGITALCTDSKQNFWAGHYENGTISVIKPEFYKNDFDKLFLPFQDHNHGDFLSFLGNIPVRIEN